MGNPELPYAGDLSQQDKTFAQDMQQVLEQRRPKEIPFKKIGIHSEIIEEYGESSQRREDVYRETDERETQLHRGLGNTATSRFELEGENDG